LTENIVIPSATSTPVVDNYLGVTNVPRITISSTKEKPENIKNIGESPKKHV